MHRARSARSVLTVDSSSFQLPSRYQFQKLLGSGSYGVVASFRDADGQEVAVKRVRRVFDNFLMLRRTLREIKLMRHFRHPNLLQLHDVLLVEAGGELYISMELMDCDLDRLVRGRGIPLEESQCRNFCSQVLLGLLHLHCAHVIHRDLKPANIFVRLKTQEVKIGDLGLSRGIAVDGETGEAIHPLEEQLTEYVVTRWYRAPEVLLARSKYGPKVDVWSVGCILYETWTAKALFPGKHSLDQLTKVVTVMGPSEEDQSWVPEESKPMMLHCSQRPAKGLSRMPGIPSGHGADLLGRLLAFDPTRRLSVEAALLHPYLESHASKQIDRAKEVEPVDVSYDVQYDGISKGGEAAALAKLSRLLRQEALPRTKRRERESEATRRSFLSRQTAEDGIQPCKGGAGSVAEVESQRSSEKSRATLQSRQERRPKLAASRSYQKIHVSPKREVDEVITADLLDTPRPIEENTTGGQAESKNVSSIFISTPGGGNRRATLPAAAIPCSTGKLRSRTAWKKALAAAQQARATLAQIDAREIPATPPRRIHDAAAREESCSKTVAPFKSSTVNEATVNEEAAITLELDKLQMLQDQQEKKLQRFLEDSDRLGRSRKLDMARDAAKMALHGTRDTRHEPPATVTPSSPSGPLRATATAGDGDRAGLETSLFDQLLETRQVPLKRPSPRRKGQQPQQSQSTPRQRRPFAASTSPRKAGTASEGRSASPKGLARRRDTASRGTQPMSQKAETFRSKSPTATGVRQEKLAQKNIDANDAPMMRRHSDAPVMRRENPFDASKLRVDLPEDKVPLHSLRSKEGVMHEADNDLDSPLQRIARALPVCPPEGDELDFAVAVPFQSRASCMARIGK